MVQRILLFVILCLNFLAISFSQSTGNSIEGIAGRVNARGLDFVREEASSYITETVLATEFPAYNGSILGVAFSIFNVEFSSFDLGETRLLTEEPDTVVIGINGASFGIRGSFRAFGSFWFFTVDVNGVVESSASDIDITQRIVLQRNEQGILAISSDGCEAGIGDFSVTVQGDSATFQSAIDVGISALSGLIRDWAGGVICDTIEEYIATANTTLLSRLNGEFDLGWNVAVDLTLPRPPAVTNSSIELAVSGRCYPTDASAFTISTLPSIFPPLSTSTSMLQLSISDYMANTFLASLYYNRMLETRLSPQKLQAILNFPLRVTIGVLRILNKNITGPSSSTDYEIVVRPMIAPRVECRPGSISVIGVYQLSVDLEDVLDEYDSSLLQIAFNITANVAGRGRILQWEIADIDLDITGGRSVLVRLFESNAEGILNAGLSAFSSSTSTGENEIELPAFGGYAIDISSIIIKQDAIELVTDIIEDVPDDDEDDSDSGIDDTEEEEDDSD